MVWNFSVLWRKNFTEAAATVSIVLHPRIICSGWNRFNKTLSIAAEYRSIQRIYNCALPSLYRVWKFCRSGILPRIFLPRHFMSGHSSRSSSRFLSLFLFLIYRSKYNSYFNSLSPPHNYRSLPLWCCDYGSIAFWINACNDVVLWFTFNLIFNCFEVILIYPWWHFYNILFDCCKLII